MDMEDLNGTYVAYKVMQLIFTIRVSNLLMVNNFPEVQLKGSSNITYKLNWKDMFQVLFPITPVLVSNGRLKCSESYYRTYLLD